MLIIIVKDNQQRVRNVRGSWRNLLCKRILEDYISICKGHRCFHTLTHKHYHKHLVVHFRNIQILKRNSMRNMMRANTKRCLYLRSGTLVRERKFHCCALQILSCKHKLADRKLRDRVGCALKHSYKWFHIFYHKSLKLRFSCNLV